MVEDTSLAAEALALTGAWVDPDKGLISLITLEMGTSSKLCALWEPGQKIVVMGPTGTPTEIPRHETVLLAGGGLGNAVLFSIGKAMREAGNRVVYFAGYKSIDGVFKVEEIEAASDIIVWAVDPLPGAEAIPTTRPQDKSFVGNIVEAMLAYATGELGEASIALSDVDRIIAIGSDGMMAAVKAARYGVLQPHLKTPHTAIGSINSSMQCMMKACAPNACAGTWIRKPARRASSTPAITRTSCSTRWISRTCISACVRTPCRKSCQTCGSTICWTYTGNNKTEGVTMSTKPRTPTPTWNSRPSTAAPGAFRTGSPRTSP